MLLRIKPRKNNETNLLPISPNLIDRLSWQY